MKLFFTGKSLCFYGNPQELADYLQEMCHKYQSFSEMLRVNLN